jgi:hypothetical protein
MSKLSQIDSVNNTPMNNNANTNFNNIAEEESNNNAI